jgi:inosine/xanthosine triphosphatase
MNLFVVCSLNPNKILAVEELLSENDIFHPFSLEPRQISSEVPHQPMDLEETVQGAMNRARNGFKSCTYSIGIEGGVMVVQGESYLITACSIFDGKQCFNGLSSSFVIPKKVSDLLKEGRTLEEAAYQSGFTQDPELGKGHGMIGLLTKGDITRKQIAKQAIRCAMVSMGK